MFSSWSSKCDIYCGVKKKLMLAIFCTLEKTSALKQHKITHMASTCVLQNLLQWGTKKMPVFPTFPMTHLGYLGITWFSWNAVKLCFVVSVTGCRDIEIENSGALLQGLKSARSRQLLARFGQSELYLGTKVKAGK